MKTTLAFLALLVVVACNRHSILPTEVITPKLDESFELRVGQIATINGDLTLMFQSVPSDSRCPKDAECFWAGNAAVILRFSDGIDTLNTISLKGIVRGAYTINMISLLPVPEFGRAISKDAYIVTLVVKKK